MGFGGTFPCGLRLTTTGKAERWKHGNTGTCKHRNPSMRGAAARVGVYAGVIWIQIGSWPLLMKRPCTCAILEGGSALPPCGGIPPAIGSSADHQKWPRTRFGCREARWFYDLLIRTLPMPHHLRRAASFGHCWRAFSIKPPSHLAFSMRGSINAKLARKCAVRRFRRKQTQTTAAMVTRLAVAPFLRGELVRAGWAAWLLARLYPFSEAATGE